MDTLACVLKTKSSAETVENEEASMNADKIVSKRTEDVLTKKNMRNMIKPPTSKIRR